jgi:hypothetical protein
MRGKTERMIEQMAACVDTDRILHELQLTEKQALALLLAKGGRRVRASRRRLSRIHIDVLACRYSPYAVQKLCELMENGKEEMRLKSALSLLDLARLKGPAKEKRRSEPPEYEATPEDRRLLERLARVMNPDVPPALPEGEEENDIDMGGDSK